MSTNNELKNETANGTKPVLADGAYVCDCGNKAKIPLCYECFKKGLEKQESPMLYSTNELTSSFIIKVFLVMFIIGIVCWKLSL
jgi:hypothetical protein